MIGELVLGILESVVETFLDVFAGGLLGRMFRRLWRDFKAVVGRAGKRR